MPETTTERLGLIKPARDTNTPLDIERLNLNMDVLDRATGTASVANGGIPPSAELYDGMIVKESTTGGVWIADKQTNGTYSKRWINFPYLYVASTYPPREITPPAGTWVPWGWEAWWPGSFNSTEADKSTEGFNFWKSPFRAVWSLKYSTFWHGGTVGALQASVFSINGFLDAINTESAHTFTGPDETTSCTFTRVLNAGDIVGHYIFLSPHTAGLASIYTVCEMVCIQRLDS